MKNKIVVLLLAAILLPCIGGAEDLNLTGGTSTAINCTDSSEFYNISCYAMCEDPCRAEVDLKGGQTYEQYNNKCEIKIGCEGEEFPAKVEFPGQIRITHNNTYTNCNIDIKDWLGRPYLNKSYEFDAETIETIVYPFEFECPAEIKTDINLENCLPYLSSAFNESDSLTYQMSYLNQMCFEDLNDCHSREMLNDKIADDCEAKYSRAFSDYESEYRKYEDCVLQLDETNENTKVGSYKAEVDDFNEQIRRGQLVPRKDHDSVVALAWVIGFILVIVLAWAFFGGGVEL